MATSAPSFARTCEIALRLDDQVTLGALQLTLAYWNAPGTFQHSLTGVKCYGDAPNTLAPFVDDPVLRTITASFVSLTGFNGPRKIAHCWFSDPSATAVPGNFQVIVEEASKIDGTIVKKTPRITVLMPDCGPDWTPTTTTTTLDTTTTTAGDTTTTTLDTTTTTTFEDSTTTTLDTTTTTEEPEPTTTTSTTSTTSTTQPFCGNGIVDDIEDCDDGNTNDGDGCDSECSAVILCGDANGNDRLQTSDALLVLRAAVERLPCPTERCDADGDEKIRASDSLRILKRSVGQSIEMSCPFEI